MSVVIKQPIKVGSSIIWKERLVRNVKDLALLIAWARRKGCRVEVVRDPDLY